MLRLCPERRVKKSYWYYRVASITEITSPETKDLVPVPEEAYLVHHLCFSVQLCMAT